MPNLSWNEIRQRAIRFSREWRDVGDECAEVQKSKVEECAQAVLDTRQGYLDEGSTLADLYDPLYMPAPLLKAHQALDRTVDRCYRKEKFTNERERVEYLFQLYEQLTAPLAVEEGKKKRKGRRKKSEG